MVKLKTKRFGKRQFPSRSKPAHRSRKDRHSSELEGYGNLRKRTSGWLQLRLWSDLTEWRSITYICPTSVAASIGAE